MKLTPEQAVLVLTETIQKKLRHPDYQRTIEVAKFNKQITTGADIDDLLTQYNPRESKEAFDQRKRITQVTTPAMAASAIAPFYKVPQTNRVVKKILPADKKNTELANQLQHKMDLFYGSDNEEGGLDFWIKNRFVELSFTDPNTFIVIEFKKVVGEKKPVAYPYEVNSQMAIRFDIVNNNIDWLISMEEIKYKNTMNTDDKDHYAKGEKYVIYCGDFSYVFRQVSNDETIRKADLQLNETAFEVDKKYYAISKYNTKLKDWQMFRIGYVRDWETDGRTYVTPLHPADAYFRKAIKSISEYDLTNALHVYPQKFSYVTPCEGLPGPQNSCDRGRTPSGGKCEACNGSGAKVHTSSQDVITFPLPDEKAEMFPLKDMMAYFSPPIELLKFQAEVIDKYEPKIHQAIFNTTVLVQKTVVATATEKDLDMDSVYVKLFPFGNKLSAVYLNIANAIAVIEDIPEGDVIFVHRLPGDYKLKSAQVLYNEYKTVTESGAPAFVKEGISDDLASIHFQDDPEGLLQYTVRKKFEPFRGKTQDEILFIMNSAASPEYNKVLWANFNEIMTEAERTKENFNLMKFDQQKPVVDEIVKRYIEESKPEPVTQLIPITAPIIEPVV